MEQSRVSVKDEKADPYNFFREYVRLEQHEHSVSGQGFCRSVVEMALRTLPL